MTAAMTPAQVAARVAQIIRSRPERWDQASWVNTNESELPDVFDVTDTLDDLDGCGTTCCVAGWAAFVAAPPGTRYDAVEAWLILPDGSQHIIQQYAADALGLDEGDDWDDANGMFALFLSRNSSEQVLAELDRIAGGAS